MTDIQRNEATPSLDMLLRKAESLIPSEILPDLVYSGQGPNTHGWHPFEMEIWAIGEAVRQADRHAGFRAICSASPQNACPVHKVSVSGVTSRRSGRQISPARISSAYI